MSVQHFRKEFKDLLEQTIIPEGSSQEEIKNKLKPLVSLMIKHMPSRLFRYRDCSEQNFDAFEKDKLFAVSSDKFNDPYDCLFRYDIEKFRSDVMAGISKDGVCALRDYYQAGGTIPLEQESFLPKEMLEKVRELLINANEDDINRYTKRAEHNKSQLNDFIDKTALEAVEGVKRLAFIVCFSEDIHSVTMWSHYANSHKGFALAYNLRSFQMKCNNCTNEGQCNKALQGNIYPVVYSKDRYDASDYLGWYIGKSYGLNLKNPDISTAFKSQLYKSPQWSYEKEWRLIANKPNELTDKTPACIEQVRPTAIFYGTRISYINKKILHSMAQEKGIDEYQMYIDNKSYNYSIKYKKL